jgi:hypothetical protein
MSTQGILMSHNRVLSPYLSIAGLDFDVDIPINFCIDVFMRGYYTSNVPEGGFKSSMLGASTLVSATCHMEVCI